MAKVENHAGTERRECLDVQRISLDINRQKKSLRKYVFNPPKMYKKLRYPEPKHYRTQTLHVLHFFLKHKWWKKSLIYYLGGLFQIIEYGYFQSKFFTSDYRVGKIQKNEKWLEGL